MRYKLIMRDTGTEADSSKALSDLCLLNRWNDNSIFFTQRDIDNFTNDRHGSRYYNEFLILPTMSIYTPKVKVSNPHHLNYYNTKTKLGNSEINNNHILFIINEEHPLFNIDLVMPWVRAIKDIPRFEIFWSPVFNNIVIV